MKIERIIAIIIVLINNEKATATELANKFQVSKRTIYRDITDISLAGIPIVTTTGTDGGIMIDNNYKINKTIFTEKELNTILLSLRSLASISNDNKYQVIIDKFTDTSESDVTKQFLIDLSSHYKKTLAPKISKIQEALDYKNLIKFEYYNSKGIRNIIIEPYYLVFQWSSWYVYGYNLKYSEFRLYKLNRILDVTILEDSFEKRSVTKEQLNFNSYFKDEIKVKILFDTSVKYRLIDEYGIECYEETSDGKLKFQVPFTNKDYLIQWVLSFGNKANFIEPIDIREEIKAILKENLNNYL